MPLYLLRCRLRPESKDTAYSQLLGAVSRLVVPYVEMADERSSKTTVELDQSALNGLDELEDPALLASKLQLETPTAGTGKLGLLSAIQAVLDGSVNTWDQGFMDKLYASTNPVSTAGPGNGESHMTDVSRWE